MVVFHYRVVAGVLSVPLFHETFHASVDEFQGRVFAVGAEEGDRRRNIDDDLALGRVRL